MLMPTYQMRPPLNARPDISIEAEGLYFGPSLHL